MANRKAIYKKKTALGEPRSKRRLRENGVKIAIIIDPPPVFALATPTAITTENLYLPIKSTK